MLSAKEKLYLLINSLVEKCHPYSGRVMYGTECPSFVYTSIHSFLRDCLLSVIDIPDEEECDFTTRDEINPQEEFINLVSRFKCDSIGQEDIVVYFPEIVLTSELIEIIEENNKDK